MSTYRLILTLACILGFSGAVFAQDITVPHTFTSGSKAMAAEVNANFAELVAAINDLRAEVEELRTENADLEALVVTLGDNSILGLADYIEVYSDSASMPSDTATQGPLIRFTGANVQIVSGEGATDAAVNGVGNLIVGYDELRPQQNNEECSDGRRKTDISCSNARGTWASNHKSGSHNLIVGARHNYSRYGGFVAGFQNSITGNGASVIGGTANRAGFEYSTVTGSESVKTTASKGRQPDDREIGEVRDKANEAFDKARFASERAQVANSSVRATIMTLDDLKEDVIRFHPSIR